MTNQAKKELAQFAHKKIPQLVALLAGLKEGTDRYANVSNEIQKWKHVYELATGLAWEAQ